MTGGGGGGALNDRIKKRNDRKRRVQNNSNEGIWRAYKKSTLNGRFIFFCHPEGALFFLSSRGSGRDRRILTTTSTSIITRNVITPPARRSAIIHPDEMSLRTKDQKKDKRLSFPAVHSRDSRRGHISRIIWVASFCRQVTAGLLFTSASATVRSKGGSCLPRDRLLVTEIFNGAGMMQIKIKTVDTYCRRHINSGKLPEHGAYQLMAANEGSVTIKAVERPDIVEITGQPIPPGGPSMMMSFFECSCAISRALLRSRVIKRPELPSAIPRRA